MALNVKQQIKKQGFETSQRIKKTERRYTKQIIRVLSGLLSKQNINSNQIFYYTHDIMLKRLTSWRGLSTRHRARKFSYF